MLLLASPVRAKHFVYIDQATLLDALDNIFSICEGGPLQDYIRITKNTESLSSWGPTESATDTGAAESDIAAQKIRKTDKRTGFAKLLSLVSEVFDFISHQYVSLKIETDHTFWKIQDGPDNRIHPFYINRSKRVLSPNPGNLESEYPNHLIVTIDSEPTGANIYCAGKLFGKTPLELDYTLDADTYKTGKFRSIPLTAVIKGYSPKELIPVINVIPDWKYKSGRTFVAEQRVHFLLNRSERN